MEDFSSLLQSEVSLLSRRLRGMAMISRGIVPDLVISQQFVDRVVKAAQGYIEDETGESMVGLVIDSDEPEKMPTMYVLDAISPDSEVIRRSHMFEHGDEMQQDIFFWLLENWTGYQNIGRDMTGKPIRDEWREELKHLGDWHKQPGFMIQPSGGDLMTALRFMEDEENQFEFLLVPIVTLGHPSVTSEEGAQVNYFTVPMDDGTSLRMDWWFIHRDVRVFQPITPKVVPTDEVPILTPYPWHILRRDLLDEEIGLLQDDNKWLTSASAIFWEADGDLPLEICFILGTGNSADVFLVITDWDYPNTKPRIRVTDFGGVDLTQYIADVFAALWDKSEPAPEPKDFEWNPESSYIVDYLAMIEKEMGIRPEGPMPWERDNAQTVMIEVETEDEDDTVVVVDEEASLIDDVVAEVADNLDETDPSEEEVP
ncbi:MAG: hypothetical protein Phog2KO_29700 [Phototrophicaceae bacterium]